MELSLSGLEPVFPVTLPRSDRSSCCGFLGKWHRVGKPTILSQGGLQSGGARQSYVQIQAPALIIPMTLGKRLINLFKTHPLINEVGILIIIMPVLFSCLADSEDVQNRMSTVPGTYIVDGWLLSDSSSLKQDFTVFSPALKALQWIWELRRSQKSKSVSVKCLLTWMQFFVCVYIAFSQKYDFSITEKPPYAWGLVLRWKNKAKMIQRVKKNEDLYKHIN